MPGLRHLNATVHSDLRVAPARRVPGPPNGKPEEPLEKADQENRVRDTTARPRCYRLGPLSRRTTTNDSLSVGRMVRLVGLVMTLRSTIVTIVYLYSQ
jgi:hypothetical protein